ncbi:hypothetical protein D0Z67_12365 [Streptomyces seoulensis]|uniref:Uncharacterized protein n=1 Tax=Streptomyces seoulensis TaxID=73044 RepID=A0A4V0ZZG6_STRSO|nr:hypothetical protein D0Z67_12365 [Streptomyces seoulensis]
MIDKTPPRAPPSPPPPGPPRPPCVTVTSVGFGASLVRQEPLMSLTPDAPAGRAPARNSVVRADAEA